MWHWIIDALYQTSEKAAVDHSCNRGREKEVLKETDVCLFEESPVCFKPRWLFVCGHPGLQGRAVGAVSVGHGKVG